jgi:hypothetical protein
LQEPQLSACFLTSFLCNIGVNDFSCQAPVFSIGH